MDGKSLVLGGELFMDVKSCFRCKKILPVDLFYKNKSKKTGYDSSCKNCFRSHSCPKNNERSLSMLVSNLEKERWLPILIDEDVSKYEISDCGRVRIPSLNFKVLNHAYNKDGYPHYTLTYKGKRYCRKAHRLVALAFIENPNKHPVVNHLDSNVCNPHYSNLEWTTHSGNAKHAFENGRLYIKYGSDHVNSKPVLNLETGIYYDSVLDASASTSLKAATFRYQMFYAIKKKRTKKFLIV